MSTGELVAYLRDPDASDSDLDYFLPFEVLGQNDHVDHTLLGPPRPQRDILRLHHTLKQSFLL